MKLHSHYTALFRSHTLWVVVCCMAIMACSCHHANDTAYYSNAVDSIEKEYKAGAKAKAKNDLYQVFATHPGAPPYYHFRKYRLKAQWNYFEDKFDSDNVYIDSMLLVLETYHLTESHQLEYAAILNSKGDHYFFENNLPKAFEYYLRGKAATLRAGDTCLVNNCSYHLGMIAYKQEKYAEAANDFKESYAETMHCPDNEYRYYRREELLNNIALSFTELKLYDSAWVYYNMALAFADTAAKTLNMPEVYHFAEKAQGVTYGSIAKIYMDLGHTDTAEKLLLKSIAINGRPGYENIDAMSEGLHLAELYIKSKRPSLAISALSAVRRGLDTIPDNTLRMQWLQQMYGYYKAVNNGPLALQYVQDYLQLRDSINAANKSQAQTDYGLLLKNQDAQYQIQLLKKDSQLDRLYLFITIGLSLMTLVVIVLVYSNYRRSRKNVKALTALNQQIGEQKVVLEDAMGRLRQSNDDKDRILHVVAHDLRNPINGILSLSHIMLDDGLGDEHKEFVEMMITASNNSLTLISEILEFSGDTIRKQTSEKEVTDINELVKQAAGILKFKAADKQQSLTLHLPPEAVFILCHPGKIGRVLSNLIANAIKFSQLNSEITIVVTKKISTVLVEVRDNGIGVPEKYKPIIFQTFTDAKRHGTSGEISFGLGLSICKQIIEAHNGRIWLESTEGKGSIFFFELPVYVATL